MMNNERILEKVKNLSNIEKRLFLKDDELIYSEILSGEDLGILPEEVVGECINMYIKQNCKNGDKDFAEWMADVYADREMVQRRFLIGKAMQELSGAYRIDYFNLRRLMRNKPPYVLINVKKLLEDLEDIDNKYKEWEKILIQRG